MESKYVWLRAAAVFVLLTLTTTAAAQADDFLDGTRLYERRDYRGAALLFEQSMKSGRVDAPLTYYCALSEQMCKNRARARQLYEYVVQRFPQSREAQLSKSALRAFQSQSASRQQSVDTSLADGKTAAAELPRQNFASRDIRGLIKVVKAKEGREEVSAPFVEDVAGQLKNIPLALLHMFRDHGLKICVTPTAIDYDPHLATVQPRGYENGKTFRNVPAFYRHPDLVIAEYCFSGDNDSSLARTDDPLGAMWHELGHAVSNVLGNLSQDPEFLRNYKKDLELMDPSVKERLSYYTQSGPGGPSETFAEMFAAIYGSRGTFWRQSQAELVYDSFREVVSFMKYKISQLR